MFTFVIETERRFYLANKVDMAATDGGWVRVRADRRVGVGHVPPRAVRLERAGHDAPRRQRRRARRRDETPRSPTRPSCRPTEPRARLRAPSTVSDLAVASALWTGEPTPGVAASWRRETRYVARGYRVVARNWRCRIGELDLVLARGSALVICEVKTRRGSRLRRRVGGGRRSQATEAPCARRGVPAPTARLAGIGALRRGERSARARRAQPRSRSSRTPSDSRRRASTSASTSVRVAR